MDALHEAHLSGINRSLKAETDAKYRKGQDEHKGNLWEMGALFFAKAVREEAIDQGVYTHDLNVALRAIHAACLQGLAPDTPEGARIDALGRIKALLEGAKR